MGKFFISPERPHTRARARTHLHAHTHKMNETQDGNKLVIEYRRLESSYDGKYEPSDKVTLKQDYICDIISLVQDSYKLF